MELWQILRREFGVFQERTGVGPDQTAKSNDFVQHLLEHFNWQRTGRRQPGR
jgi:ribosomal protein S15P/S13E